jgi:hypothetical protein
MGKSKARKRKPRTSKTYSRKLTRLKKWHSQREKERKTWSKERLDKVKPLQPLSWYVEKLKQSGKGEPTKVSSNLTSPKRGSWFR